YRTRNSAVESPFDARFTTKINRPLDVAKMQIAARDLIGTYDCISLCAAGSSAAAHGDTVRTVTDCHVLQEGEVITISITANGYLYNMVRIVAGTLVEIGEGRRAVDSIPTTIASKNRQNAGQTLAAKGLSLVAVHYPEAALLPEPPEVSE
ncbi:MAG: tRNA pseudouridine(38-40) synthase TruA, partial [Faecalibacterium sp.]